MPLEVKRLTEAEKRFGQEENLSIVSYAGVLGWFCTKNLQTIDKTVFELPDGGKQKIEDEMDAVCRELALRYYRLPSRPGSDGIGSDFRGLTGGYYFFDPGEGEYAQKMHCSVREAGGSILLELQGEERANMTVDGLLALFRQKTGAALDNDRMLLA